MLQEVRQSPAGVRVLEDKRWTWWLRSLLSSRGRVSHEETESGFRRLVVVLFVFFLFCSWLDHVVVFFLVFLVDVVVFVVVFELVQIYMKYRKREEYVRTRRNSCVHEIVLC